MVRKLLLVAALVIGSAALTWANGSQEKQGAQSSQSSAGGAKVTITLADEWAPGSTTGEAPIAVRMLQQWEQEHPNVHLVVDTVPGDALLKVIPADVAANNAPDVWMFWVGNVLNRYARAGVLLDMNKFLAASNEVKKSDMTPDTWSTVTVDGVVRALPADISLGSFFANSTIFKKYGMSYPKTWSEFIADGKFFRAHGITPTNIGSKGGNPSHLWYNALCDQFKSCWAATRHLSTSLSFHDPAFLKAAKYVNEMRTAGMFPSDVVANGGWGPTVALYDQGKAAMGFTFPFEYSHMPASIIAQTVIIPVPQIPGSNVNTSTFTEGTVNDSYCAYAKAWNDPAKRAAMTSLLNLLEVKMGFAFAQAGIAVSADQSVMSKVDRNKIKSPMVVKTIQYQQKTKESGAPMIWQHMPSGHTQSQYLADLDKLWAGIISPQEFVNEIQKAFNAYKANQ